MAFKPIFLSNILPFFQSTFWSLGVGSVPFEKNRLVEKIASDVGLASFQTVQCLHKNVSGFASNILLPP